MRLPAKTTEVAKFNETEEEVYFLKQVTTFARRKRLTKDMFSGRDCEDIGKGLSIWLCKMKPDGSEKTEIKELWKNPAYPIQTDVQSTWMSVNVKTRTIALSIIYAGSDLTGLWTVKLDGSALREIIMPALIDGHTQAIDSPCWSPDGQWIVFSESLRGGQCSRFARCDREGKQLVYLTNGPADSQPRISPDGKQIAYIHWVGAASRLYLMSFDGTRQHPLPNPEDKRWGTHGGTYPTWSPDGERILSTGCIIAIDSGRTLIDRDPKYKGKPYTCGWPHWGRTGIVGFGVGGIVLADPELKETQLLASSRTVKFSGNAKDADKW